MLRGILTVGGWTMASRVLGFARDMLIAARLGAGPLADVFFVALQLPNLFRRLFGEGAFNAAFIPAFSGTLATQGPRAARDLAERMASLMAVWLSARVLLLLHLRPSPSPNLNLKPSLSLNLNQRRRWQLVCAVEIILA